jgi:hypothetical protein
MHHDPLQTVVDIDFDNAPLQAAVIELLDKVGAKYSFQATNRDQPISVHLTHVTVEAALRALLNHAGSQGTYKVEGKTF